MPPPGWARPGFHPPPPMYGAPHGGAAPLLPPSGYGPPPRPFAMRPVTDSLRVWVGKLPKASSVPDEVVERILREAAGTMSGAPCLLAWKRARDPETDEPKAFGFASLASAAGAKRLFSLVNGLNVEESARAIVGGGSRVTSSETGILVNADSTTKPVIESTNEEGDQPPLAEGETAGMLVRCTQGLERVLVSLQESSRDGQASVASNSAKLSDLDRFRLEREAEREQEERERRERETATVMRQRLLARELTAHPPRDEDRYPLSNVEPTGKSEPQPVSNVEATSDVEPAVKPEQETPSVDAVPLTETVHKGGDHGARRTVQESSAALGDAAQLRQMLLAGSPLAVAIKGLVEELFGEADSAVLELVQGAVLAGAGSDGASTVVAIVEELSDVVGADEAKEFATKVLERVFQCQGV
jgi:hypothetical protein